MSSFKEHESGVFVPVKPERITRPVFFEINYNGTQYIASHGGTCIVGLFRGTYYAITCAHVVNDFEPKDCAIINSPDKADKISQILGYYKVGKLEQDAAGSDIGDLVAFDLGSDHDFWGGDVYTFDHAETSHGKVEDQLKAIGYLKDGCEYSSEHIHAKQLAIEMKISSENSSDPALKKSIACNNEGEFDNLTGLSGGAVFNERTKHLEGMIVRATSTGTRRELYYIETTDIVKFLTAISDNSQSIHYCKSS